jgi:hypothetical protein
MWSPNVIPSLKENKELGSHPVLILEKKQL